MFRKAALRLTLFYTAVIVAVLLIAGLAAYAIVAYSLQAGAQEQLWATARALQRSEALRERLSRATLQGIPSSHEEETLGQPSLLPSLLFDSQGRLVASVEFGMGGENDEEFDDDEDGHSLEALIRAFQDSRREALDGTPTLRQVEVEDHPLWLLSLPAVRSGQVVGAAQTYVDVGDQHRLLGALRNSLLVVGAGSAAVALLSGYLLSLRALAPLRTAFDRQRAFIASASHQLRTPVAVIRADADALERSAAGLKEEDLQLLHDLVHEADFLTALIRDLIVQARLDAPEGPAARRPIDLALLARESADAVAPLVRSRGQRLTVDAPQQGLVVDGDESSLRLALLALLDNAVKYNRPHGQVAVRAFREDRWGSISIADQGPGIPAEEQEKVFERFYRGANAQAARVEGAGLGLSIVRQVARNHGGDAVLSSSDRGTTVTLRLPLHP
jgi:signal transduction histidine kinase